MNLHTIIVMMHVVMRIVVIIPFNVMMKLDLYYCHYNDEDYYAYYLYYAYYCFDAY